jgi:hypothetical protein
MDTCFAFQEVITWLQTLSAVLAMLCASLVGVLGLCIWELRRLHLKYEPAPKGVFNP